MSNQREGEHRVTEQYREPLGSARGVIGIGQAAPWFAICFLIVLLGLVLGGWMFVSWLTTDAWHAHPIAVCIFYVVCASPFAWWAYTAVDNHMENKRDRAAQRSVIYNQAEALQLNAGRGFNTEVEGALTTIRVINPVSLASASKETNNYYGDIGDGEEDVPQIEAPRAEDEYLNISEDYQPHADEFLSGRKLIAGISGSGKSNTVATICEEYGRLGVPMILADTENEYQALGNNLYLPNYMLADRSHVTKDNAEQFGHYILENHKQVILDLTDYDREEAAWVMVNIIKGMKDWEEKFANELRIPCEFMLEEAPTWLPQNVGESPLKGTTVWQPLQDAFFNNLVRKGRKRGLGITVICQRVAEIDKRALQSNAKILHRQTDINDLKKYREMGVSDAETTSLGDGEAYFFSSRVSKMLIQMRERYSPHGANTPGLKALRAHNIAVSPVTPDFRLWAPSQGEGNGHQKPVYGNLGGFPEVHANSQTAILDGPYPSVWEGGDDTMVLEPVESLPTELPIDFQTSNSMPDGKYKFSPDEGRLVVELYKAYRNIDKVLAHMERGARWHKDASRLIREAGLL